MQLKTPMGMSSKENPATFLNTATIREIAVSVLATLLFFFTVMLVPMLGLFVGIFTPLPTLLFYYRWGAPRGYLVPGAAALIGSLLMAFLGMHQSLPYFYQMLLLGILLGSGMRKQWSPEKVIGSGSLFIFLMGVLGFWIAYGGAGGNIIQSIEKDLHDSLSVMLQHYGAVSPEKQLMEHSLSELVPTLVRVLPGAGLSSALVVSWLNVLVTWRYCRAHRILQPMWESWSQWKTPEILVWAVVACGFMLLVPFGPSGLVGLNGLIVLGTLYLFQGLSIASFYFEKWHLPRFLRLFAYGFLLLQQFVTLGAILMGLFDVWFDFRRLTRKPTEAG